MFGCDNGLAAFQEVPHLHFSKNKPSRKTLSEKLLIGRKEAQKAQEKLEKNHFVA